MKGFEELKQELHAEMLTVFQEMKASVMPIVDSEWKREIEWKPEYIQLTNFASVEYDLPLDLCRAISLQCIVSGMHVVEASMKGESKKAQVTLRLTLYSLKEYGKHCQVPEVRMKAALNYLLGESLEVACKSFADAATEKLRANLKAR